MPATGVPATEPPATAAPILRRGLTKKQQDRIEATSPGVSVGVVMGGASLAMSAGKMAMLRSFGCEVDDVDLGFGEQLDFEFHPSRVALGTDLSRYLRGAIVMNHILLGLFGMTFVLVAYIATKLCSGFHDGIMEAYAWTKMPGVLIVPAMFLWPGTVLAAARLLFFPSVSKAWAAAGAFVLFTSFVAIGVIHVYVVRRVPANAQTLLDPLLYSPYLCAGSQEGIQPAPPKMLRGWKRSLYWFAFGDTIWINHGVSYFSEQYGVIFDSYKEDCAWVLVAEIVINVLLALLSAWKPESAAACNIRNTIISVIFTLFFLVVLVLRPFTAMFDNLCGIALSGMTAVALLSMTIGIAFELPGESMTFQCSAFCLFYSAILLMAKGVWDLGVYVADLILSRRASARDDAREQARMELLDNGAEMQENGGRGGGDAKHAASDGSGHDHNHDTAVHAGRGDETFPFAPVVETFPFASHMSTRSTAGAGAWNESMSYMAPPSPFAMPQSSPSADGGSSDDPDSPLTMASGFSSSCAGPLASPGAAPRRARLSGVRGEAAPRDAPVPIALEVKRRRGGRQATASVVMPVISEAPDAPPRTAGGTVGDVEGHIIVTPCVSQGSLANSQGPLGEASMSTRGSIPSRADNVSQTSLISPSFGGEGGLYRRRKSPKPTALSGIGGADSSLPALPAGPVGLAVSTSEVDLLSSFTPPRADRDASTTPRAGGATSPLPSLLAPGSAVSKTGRTRGHTRTSAFAPGTPVVATSTSWTRGGDGFGPPTKGPMTPTPRSTGESLGVPRTNRARGASAFLDKKTTRKPDPASGRETPSLAAANHRAGKGKVPKG